MGPTRDPGGDGLIPMSPSTPHSGGRRRGDSDLAPELRAIIESVGKDKLTPDITADERYYSRSLAYRRKIAEFLMQNEGTTWTTLEELCNRAGNYAGCSVVTARRWVKQFTVAGTAHKIVQSIDYIILERRGDNGEAQETKEAP